MKIAPSLPSLHQALGTLAACPTHPGELASTQKDIVELGSTQKNDNKTAAPAATKTAAGAVGAVAAGVVGGAVIAGAVAAASGFAGLQLGSLILGSQLVEQLPKAVALLKFLHVSEGALLASPLLGALAGGVVGACAHHPATPPSPSQIPGSGVALDAQAAHVVPDLHAAFTVGSSAMREAGTRVHDDLVKAATTATRGEAARAGAAAGVAFGSEAGRVGGRIMGLAQGATLGAMIAGLPFTFAPWVAIPVALVGALGLSNTTATLGAALGAGLAAPLGAVAGTLARATHTPPSNPS